MMLTHQWLQLIMPSSMNEYSFGKWQTYQYLARHNEDTRQRHHYQLQFLSPHNLPLQCIAYTSIYFDIILFYIFAVYLHATISTVNENFKDVIPGRQKMEKNN